MYPVTIVDNFFDDPDAIVRLSEEMEWRPTPEGKWPGARTEEVWAKNDRLFNYIGARIHGLFYEGNIDEWVMQMRFQKIFPFSEDKWNKKNRGWVHTDLYPFGGIIYLTKDPEPDTGTSIFKCKHGGSKIYGNEIQVKKDLYTGVSTLSQDEFDKVYDDVHDQYIETVRVENVYNRLLLFGGNTLHGVRTYGAKERLTLNFFGEGVFDSERYTPFDRMRPIA